MKRVEALYTLTKEMLELLDKPCESFEARDRLIESIDAMLNKRETLVQQVQPPYTEEEVQLGKQIVEMDRIIKEKMHHVLGSIEGDLRRLKQKKDSDKTYINPYKNLETVDGMYVDNKL